MEIYNPFNDRDQDMYFKVIMERGHMGAGKSCEIVRYFRAKNLETLFDVLKNYPGVKSKNLGGAVTIINPVSREEYERGKAAEKAELCDKRAYIRKSVTVECSLGPVSSDSGSFEHMTAKIVDYSEGGLCLKYRENKLPAGCRVKVLTEALDATEKEACVVWSKHLNGTFKSGLKWV